MGSDQISLTDLDTFPKEIVAAIKRTREQLPTIRNSLRKAGVGRR
jgi:hypothetical protein